LNLEWWWLLFFLEEEKRDVDGNADAEDEEEERVVGHEERREAEALLPHPVDSAQVGQQLTVRYLSSAGSDGTPDWSHLAGELVVLQPPAGQPHSTAPATDDLPVLALPLVLLQPASHHLDLAAHGLSILRGDTLLPFREIILANGCPGCSGY